MAVRLTLSRQNVIWSWPCNLGIWRHWRSDGIISIMASNWLVAEKVSVTTPEYPAYGAVINREEGCENWTWL